MKVYKTNRLIVAGGAVVMTIKYGLTPEEVEQKDARLEELSWEEFLQKEGTENKDGEIEFSEWTRSEGNSFTEYSYSKELKKYLQRQGFIVSSIVENESEIIKEGSVIRDKKLEG